MFHWRKGRQNTGYDVLTICSSKWPIPFDLYIIRYNQGAYIPPHIDIIESGKHYRLNVVLKNADIGGEFVCKNPIYETSRIKLFRPDISEHSVTKIFSGTRYVLSLGWLR